MHIDLTGNHVELTDALRSYVKEKMSRLERHSDQVKKVHVVLKVDKKRHIAETSLHVPGGNGDLHANATHEDMYAAIDSLVDKLDRQIIKHKEKLSDHHRREKAAINSQI